MTIEPTTPLPLADAALTAVAAGGVVRHYSRHVGFTSLDCVMSHVWFDRYLFSLLFVFFPLMPKKSFIPSDFRT